MCPGISQTAIDIGSVRGCCHGPTISCQSTFFTACVPMSKLPGRGTNTNTASDATATETASSKPREIWCEFGQFTECWTAYFSYSTAPSTTYTLYDCAMGIDAGMYEVQDFPPDWVLNTTSSAGKTKSTGATSAGDAAKETQDPSPPQHLTTDQPSSSPPIGAIVGGVIGGLAVISLLIMGLYYIHRKTRLPQQQPFFGPNDGGMMMPPPSTATNPDAARRSEAQEMPVYSPQFTDSATVYSNGVSPYVENQQNNNLISGGGGGGNQHQYGSPEQPGWLHENKDHKDVAMVHTSNLGYHVEAPGADGNVNGMGAAEMGQQGEKGGYRGS